MIGEISRTELTWFEQWIEQERLTPPVEAARRVVILHPGARWAPGRVRLGLPPYENGPDDARASEEQRLLLEQCLHDTLGPRARCSIALYAGFLSESDDGRSDGFDEPSGTWHRGRLNYVLFSGELHECAYAGVDRRWGSGRTFLPGAPFPIVELSYLWTDDRSVFVASPPDTGATIVHGPDTLLDRLISLPELRAQEWLASA
ncbi:hypothetical protein LJR045_002791 [Microbacterium sp. LjRoot45]|uniref:hypothetical protein n=1 Tax=Microbacterium sp. LjRoot45 TaxID=3342329 RepID=UPI003ECF038F